MIRRHFDTWISKLFIHITITIACLTTILGDIHGGRWLCHNCSENTYMQRAILRDSWVMIVIVVAFERASLASILPLCILSINREKKFLSLLFSSIKSSHRNVWFKLEVINDLVARMGSRDSESSRAAWTMLLNEKIKPEPRI